MINDVPDFHINPCIYIGAREMTCCYLGSVIKADFDDNIPIAVMSNILIKIVKKQSERRKDTK